jgi:hypothetical protein
MRFMVMICIGTHPHAFNDVANEPHMAADEASLTPGRPPERNPEGLSSSSF